ncbi:response regulator [Salipiger sp. IMCC34102]|uniref:response regulator n=1 Tax=Salipiger sp. IMCC34102 TaxID=2510647 RepID=UPI00101CFF30|nr:response regulator [Salipiger sp. IMCC34102]RYH02012.1 response regulator [Salipiger sp. IMCC34102]
MKILFVDNEEDMISLIDIVLETEDDIDLSTANTGQAGIDLIDFEEFDAYLFDLMMPKPDGRDLLAHVRSRPESSTKPVIMCTAKSDESFAEKLLQAGATRVISKPFNALTIADVIRDVVNGG